MFKHLTTITLCAVLAVALALPGPAQAPPDPYYVAGNLSEAIYKVDPVSGDTAVVSSAGIFSNGVSAIAAAPDGNLLVADQGGGPIGNGSVIRVHPGTGAQNTVTSLGLLGGGPIGITVAANGDILVAEWRARAVLRVDPVTGAQSVVSSGGILTGPTSVSVDAGGSILVTEPNAVPPAVVRIDPVTGAQSVVSSGGNLQSPGDLAVAPDGHLLVLDRVSVLRIDPVTGSQVVISSGGSFVEPRGIAVSAAGEIVVADKAFGGSGGLIRVDPATGAQTVVSSGGLLSDPGRLTIRTLAGPPPQSAPSAPLKLSAYPNRLSQQTARTQINLEWWNSSTDQSSVTVYRAKGTGAFTAVATLSGAATQPGAYTNFTDTGLSRKTTYSYRVQATNGAGNSANSNTATATTNP